MPARSLRSWLIALTTPFVVATGVLAAASSADADSLTTTIPLGDFVVGAAISPDGSQLYVTRSPNLVDVVSTVTNTKTSTITVGDNPRDVEFSQDGMRGYVPNYGDNTLSVIDTGTGSVTGTIPLGSGNPTDVAVSPDRTFAYVTMVTSGTVKVVDLHSGTVSRSINVGSGPNSVALTSDGSRAFVANAESDSVSMIETATGTVAATTSVGDEPFSVAISPDGQRVYTTNYGSRTVSVLSGADGSTAGSPITLSGRPLGVDFTPNGNRALVATRGPDAVSFIDVSAGISTGSIPLGAGPLDVAITPDAGTAYITNFFTFAVSVIDMIATPEAPTAVVGVPAAGRVELSWAAPTDAGDAPITGYRIQSQISPGNWVTVVSDTGSAATSATVGGLTNGSNYRFRVLAVNSAGPGAPSAASTPLVPRTIPGAPSTVTATAGNGQVLLAWLAPAADGGSPVTGYRVEMEVDGGSWITAAANTTSTSTSFTVEGLTNGSNYRFRVSAINAAGTGLASDSSTAVRPLAPPGPATGVTGSAGNGQVTLSWTAPVSSGGSLILGYRVESKVGDGPWTLRVASTDSPTPTADVTGLANGTPYSFRVSAISSGGTGSPSDPSAPITPRTVPSAPTNVTGTAGNARVDLAWNAPTDDGGAAVVSYRVDAQAAGGSWITVIADTGSVDTSASVNALVNGTQYRFRVAAINASGTSQTSTPSQWVTPRTTPGQASEVSGQPGDQQVALTWTAPPSNGGAAISGYRIDQKAGNDSWSVAIPDTGNVMTATTVTGLGNGTDYQFRVAALNEAGDGPASAPSPSVTPRTFPDAANNVQAMAGNGQVQLSWLAPASDGGSPITGYRIEARAGDGSWTVAQASTDSTATIWVVTGLTNGVQYRFRVAAINVAGVGTFSTQTDPTTPVTTPSEPTNLFATPQDEQVALSWNAPGTTGGSPITGYRIEQKQGDSTWTVAVEDTGSVSPTASISGLTNGAEYRFRVSAVNAQGAGQPSTATPVVIPRTTPGTPSQLAGTPGDGYIDLVWTAPSSTGGSPITGYQVELKKGTDAWTVGIADTGSTQTSARVTSLINGQNYRFRVAALNAAGAGPPSTVTPAQIPRSTPGAPTTLRGLPGDETITLSWTEPNNTGGVGITGYRVEMRAGSASWDVLVDDTGSSATTWLATGLTNGIPHRFRVSARNEAGLGPASAATGDLLPLTTAGPPSAVNGVAQDRGVALTWIAPTSDGGSPIAGYRIEIKESGAEWRTAVNDTSSTTTTWLVSGLQNGRAYAFRVAALNSAGAGTVSAPSPEVTPKSADNAPTAPPVEPTPGSTEASRTAKVTTAVTGWPSRAKPRSGKVRLTVQISPSEGRLAVIERRACNRKAGKLQCRWLQVGTQQLPASRDAVVRFTLRARQQIGRYRLVIPETGSAHAATTGVVKVRAVKK